MIKPIGTLVTVISALSASMPVAAHTGTGAVHGFLAGLSHPAMGLDHLLTMVAVGLWAVHLGGRALLMLPLSFIGLMAIGAGLGFHGIDLPHAEAGITLSLVILGLALWQRWPVSIRLAGLMTACFAVFHGYVHALELNGSEGQVYAYSSGFLCATALLHGVGMGLGRLLKPITWGRPVFGLFCTGTGLYWLMHTI